MSASSLPPLRQPPHDPFSLLLGGRLGWPLLDHGLPDDGGTLRLPRFPGSLRRLTEGSGSLGGLRPPANVAVADGEVWLLSSDQPRLLRFDPCTCGFVEVPCFGGTGPGAGQLVRPSGIAVRAGHLFVCDTGNQRIQVVLLPHLVVSALWRAPFEWEPTGVVVDDRFRVHVVDTRGGMVHHFGWSGRYLGNTPGVGASRWIGLASDGSLYVAGPVEAYRVGTDGHVVPVSDSAADLEAAFPRGAFDVAADGRMHLGPRCLPASEAWFDGAGRPAPVPSPPVQLYERAATAVVGPLDSLIDECVWDRVDLVGSLPAGCTIGLETHTAQVPLSAPEVSALPDQAWQTHQTWVALEAGGRDALVRSAGGRYLWLRLRLAGNGAQTPRLDEIQVDFPRIGLRRHLPAVYGVEPTSADFTDRLLAIFDRSLRDIEAALDDLPALFDPHATRSLDWLASWVGLRPDRRLPEAMQRDIVANAKHILDLRGTAAGLRRLLLTALGLDGLTCDLSGPGSCPHPRQSCPPRAVAPSRYEPPPLVLEHFRIRRWFEAGAGRLGDQTVLWGQSIVDRTQLGVSAQVGGTALWGAQDPLRDPFHVHAHKFTVFVPASAGRTQERRRALERLVAWASPAQTVGHVEYVDARLRIGVQSSIGLDTVVARMPAGFTVSQTSLGPASVLDGDDRRSIDSSAVGTTTLLG